MWIRAQKKETLIYAKFICVDKGLLKKSKAVITAMAFGSSMPTTLGEYETFEEAKRVFEDIQANIVDGTKLYIMP